MTSATAGKPNHMQEENEWMWWTEEEQQRNSCGNLLRLLFLRSKVGKTEMYVQKQYEENALKKRKEKVEIIKNAVEWDGTTAGGRIWRRDTIRTGQFLSEQRQGVCDIQVRFSLEVWISPFYVLVMGFIIWLMGCQSNLVHEGRDRHIKKVVLGSVWDVRREHDLIYGDVICSGKEGWREMVT